MASTNKERQERSYRRLQAMAQSTMKLSEATMQLFAKVEEEKNAEEKNADVGSPRKNFTPFTTYRMPQRRDRISLEFKNLVLTVGNTKKVINGVSGFIEGGESVAIMGESGAVSAYTCVCI